MFPSSSENVLIPAWMSPMPAAPSPSTSRIRRTAVISVESSPVPVALTRIDMTLMASPVPAEIFTCTMGTPSAPGISCVDPGFPGPASTCTAAAVIDTTQGLPPTVHPLDPTTFTARTR
jgi:hypothetical protein